MRRPAVLLGTILMALALAGSAWGQTLGGVVSTVDEVAAPVEELTEPVTKAVEPVTKPVTKATAPVTKATEPVAQNAPVTRTVEKAAQPVVSTAATTTRSVVAPVARSAEPVVKAAASTVDTVAGRATRSVEPLATAATGAVTGTLRAGTSALPTETQALLGPLVETVDGRAEELTGSLLGPTAAGLGETVGAATGVLSGSQGSPGFSAPPTGMSGGSPQAEQPAATAQTAVKPARSLARSAAALREAPLVRPPALGSPLFLPAPTQVGRTPAGEAGSPAGSPAPAAPSGHTAPAAPTSAFGSATGSSAALVVLAGLFALALASLLGRLLPWSDTIRPLAFVSPPDRPG